jgi:hypothetical protein
LVASNYVAKGVKNGTPQTIPNETDTIVTFIDDFDPQGWITSNKFQPNIEGYYTIQVAVWWNPATSGSTGQNNIQLRKNGTTQVAIQQSPLISTDGYGQEIDIIVFFNGTTDYVEVTAYSANPTSQNINGAGTGTWITASLIVGGGTDGSSGTSGTSGSSGTSGVSLPFTPGAWGSFISTESQYITSTTTAYSMSAATQTSGNGVIVSADTRFVVASAGTYNLQFSCQIESTGGGSAQTMDIWLAINGNNVDNSNTQVVGNSNNGRSVASWNFVEPLNAGDYMELKFRVSDIRLGFAYDIAQINPTRPAIPSVIVTVTQV